MSNHCEEKQDAAVRERMLLEYMQGCHVNWTTDGRKKVKHSRKK